MPIAISPSTAGWPMRVARSPPSLAATKQQRKSQRDRRGGIDACALASASNGYRVQSSSEAEHSTSS